MATVDITIRGAGIFGLSCAWALLQRGAQVQVVDPGGVAAGASGGLVGALAPHTPERWEPKKAFQFDSLDGAEAFWRQVEDAAATPSGYARTGRLQGIQDQHGLELARLRVEDAKTLWKGRYQWQVEQADGPWMPRSATGWIIRDTLSAHLHPRQATLCLAQAITALGGRIVTDAPDAGTVLWCTGVAGLEALSAEHGREVGNGVKGQAALLEFDMSGAPQVFTDGIHIIPHLDGTTAIGSTSERYYDDSTTTDDQLEDVITRARAALPALADARVIRRWAGVRPRAKTRAPMLGAWPDRPGHFIANGGFKIGFGMAPKVAQVMADLILNDVDRIPDDFRVSANL